MEMCFRALVVVSFNFHPVCGRLFNIFVATQCANATGVPESRGLVWNGALIDFGLMQLRQSFPNVYNISHSYLYDNRRSDENQLADDSENFLAKYYYQNIKQADAVASLACTSRSVIQAAQMTRALRMLHITGMGNGPTQRTHPNFISVSIVSAKALFDACVKVFRLNKWSSISSIIDDRFIAIVPQSRALHEDFVSHFAAGTYRDLRYTPFHLGTQNGLNDTSRLLRQISDISRVVFVLTTGERFRDIMIQAYQNNFTNGEFVFLLAVPWKRGVSLAQGANFTWKRGDDKDAVALEAYKSVLLVSHVLDYPDDPVPNFRQHVMEIAASRYNTRYPNNIVPTNLYTCYEMFLLYGIVANESLHENVDLNDGYALASRIRNRTFHLPTGDLHIDEHGERTVDIVYDAFDDTTGEFIEVYRYDQQDDSLEVLKDIGSIGTGFNWPLTDPPTCGYRRDRCSGTTGIRSRIIAVAVTLCVLAFGTVVLAFWIRKRWNPAKTRWWDLTAKFAESDSDPRNGSLQQQSSKTKSRNMIRVSNSRILLLPNGASAWSSATGRLLTNDVQGLPKPTVQLLEKLGALIHDNVNRFLGVTCLSGNFGLYEAWCPKGSLQDLVVNTDSAQLELKVSLILDLVSGLKYIHRSPFLYHGELTTTKCLLDSHFGLKISDMCQRVCSTLRFSNGREIIQPEHVPLQKLLFWPPERLGGANPSTQTDPYSFAIVSHSVLCHVPAFRVRPRYEEADAEEVVKSVMGCRNPPHRPEFDPTLLQTDFGKRIAEIVQPLWAEAPMSRPTVHQAYDNLTELSSLYGFTGRTKTNFVERVIARLSVYAETLETNVEERTNQLLLEKSKCETVLREIFPREIMKQLQAGLHVVAEYFDSVTVGFSSIVGFLDFMKLASPREASALLDVVFKRFDAELVYFDMFKVETIGDIYMVASGLPARNGTKHATEICSVALRLLTAFQSMRTASGTAAMGLRVGLHTGDAAAGVVGHRCPRYCLFGDAVNTASRMESHGVAGRIHISSLTANLAKKNGFLLDTRGETIIKGKGALTTYWLLSPKI